MATRKNGDNESGGEGKKVAPKGRKSARRGEMEGKLVQAADALTADRVYDCPGDCNRLTVIVKKPRAAIDRLTVTL